MTGEDKASAHPGTPAEAWAMLMEGNRRFVESIASHPNQDAARRSSLTRGQHPFVTIFGCSGSRLAAEIIFDMGLGDAFVVRTVGHAGGARARHRGPHHPVRPGGPAHRRRQQR